MKTDYTAQTVAKFAKIAANILPNDDIESFCSRISVFADIDPCAKGNLPRLVIHLADENLGRFGADIFIEFRGTGWKARCERVENWSRPSIAMAVSHPLISAQATANIALEALLRLYADLISKGHRTARIHLPS